MALHERLLREEPAPAPPPVAAAGGTVDAAAGLVERERELAALGALLGDALAGEGRSALIEGPAGVGKTRLLAEVRRRAEAAGALVLSARGSDLEREFPFGVVRQLLEGLLLDPDAAARAFAGSGAPARAVFERLEAPGEGGSDFAALHGLYWVVLNLSAERPLVLSVDDLHWADRPSLRYLAYLARRLEGQPVLLAATLRTGEPDTDLALVGEIAGDAATGSVRPAPLSEAAVAEVVRARLGADADDAFCAACHVTTGGNPLLLRQLLTALEAEDVRPDAAHADVVRAIGSRAIASAVVLRLARLPEDAAAVARAVAVLGDGADLRRVAALAETGDDAHGDGRRGALARRDPAPGDPAGVRAPARARGGLPRHPARGARAGPRARRARAARGGRADRPGRRAPAERAAARRGVDRRRPARGGQRRDAPRGGRERGRAPAARPGGAAAAAASGRACCSSWAPRRRCRARPRRSGTCARPTRR